MTSKEIERRYLAVAAMELAGGMKEEPMISRISESDLKNRKLL